MQEVLSKGKRKKTQLTELQKAIRWRGCDKKGALQKYKSLDPIELPSNESELPDDVDALK